MAKLYSVKVGIVRQLIATGLTALFVSTGMTIDQARAQPGDPIQIVVSLDEQHLRVFRGLEQIASSNISSGKKGYSTPTGVFSILQKNRHHRSNIYSGAPMPFMQRLTWSGVALHASNHVPRRPASHGCVRMPHKFAGKLFKMATNGMHVVIEDNPELPREVKHEALFQPKLTWATSKTYDTWVNDHIEQSNTGFVKSDDRYPARIFITRRTHKDELFDVQRMLNVLGYQAGKVDGIMGPDTWKAISGFQKAHDMSGDGKLSSEFLDRLYKTANRARPANGRLLVRKHHRTVFETQVHLSDPERPLGSHLLTVSGFDKKVGKTSWVGLTLNDRIQQTIYLRDGKEIDPTSGRASAEEVFSRVKMSKHDREQISRLLSDKSSITISDNGMSIETGARGTDFVVITDPEPGMQKIVSGLKKVAG